MAPRKKPVAGKDDQQVFTLNCPTCQKPLVVTNFRTGELDRIRGIHRIHKYGWVGQCRECGEKWGSEDDPTIAPSLWVLSDIVAKQ